MWLVDQALEGRHRIAVGDPGGTCTYGDLVATAGRIARALRREVNSCGSSPAPRIAHRLPPGILQVQVLLGIWRAGGIAVPLAGAHPLPELAHVLETTAASAVVLGRDDEAELRGWCRRRGIVVLDAGRVASLQEQRPDAVRLREVQDSSPAMILFTSGTTGRPKGVVHTHASLRAQVESLLEAWAWSEQDRILHVLPLHHVHGLVNVLLCALAAGARCDFLPRFDARKVWTSFVERPYTLFMAVPTIYERLLSAWHGMSAAEREACSEACRKLRLFVSGSAALPVGTLAEWEAVSGHVLLERYGMTEIGMALSNPLDGERRAGFVGVPLPGVEVRLDSREPLSLPGAGEIEVRGPGVFLEYWNDPEATRAAFREGWFRTGDLACVEGGSYRILGRIGTDIIKTGGYKVSALEIEETLRDHPLIVDCAVVGIPDPEWGERVAAAVVVSGGDLELEELRRFCRKRIAPYKIPTRLMRVDSLPRNALGKVRKGRMRWLF